MLLKRPCYRINGDLWFDYAEIGKWTVAIAILNAGRSAHSVLGLTPKIADAVDDYLKTVLDLMSAGF